MNPKKVFHELKHHAPFTFVATLIAILLVMIIKFLLNKEIPESAFHILHPVHLFFSAIVTSAIYFKYKKNIFNALLIGITGSIIIGSFSDIIFPFIGGIIFNMKLEFHLPLIEDPFLILSTAVIGSFTGIITKASKMPHFIHVFLSIFASLFYLIVFSQTFSLINFLSALIIVFIAVLIPCCISDIIYPLIFVRNNNSRTIILKNIN